MGSVKVRKGNCSHIPTGAEIWKARHTHSIICGLADLRDYSFPEFAQCQCIK
jgi:hypothetical protein